MTHTPKPATRERILLVEDSSTQAQGTRLVLQAAGFEVQVCDRGTVALAAAAAQQPDLLLLDLYLPDLSGREVAKRLKADPTLSGIPIIFLTGVFRDVAAPRLPAHGRKVTRQFAPRLCYTRQTPRSAETSCGARRLSPTAGCMCRTIPSAFASIWPNKACQQCRQAVYP